MHYCSNCKAQLDDGNLFCTACGTKQENIQPQSSISETIKPQPIVETLKPIVGLPIEQQQIRGKTNWWIFVVICLFAAGLITFGVLYFIEHNSLVEANENIVSLEENVASLQTDLISKQQNIDSLQEELSIELENVSSLESQLAEEIDKSTGLQTQLTAATNDLNASRTQVAQLQSDLNASNAQVTDLQSQLSASLANVASIQDDLDDAISELNDAIADLTSANNELNRLTHPRHFNTLSELQNWLANDDTDTKNISEGNKALVIQANAQSDGYIVMCELYTSEGYIYAYCNAVVGGDKVYSWKPNSDAPFLWLSGITPAYPIYPIGAP